jgi:hypothetical protein
MKKKSKTAKHSPSLSTMPVTWPISTKSVSSWIAICRSSIGGRSWKKSVHSIIFSEKLE